VKISDIPLAIEDGINTPIGLCVRYRFNRRQASYYLRAAESLGLIIRRRGGKYSLTSEGRRYTSLTPIRRKEILVRGMLSSPIVARIVLELLVSPNHHLTRRQVMDIAAAHTGISGTTIGRRVQSLFSWLSWLAEETGILKVSKSNISMTVYSRRRSSP
jgi:AAA domain-containing protein